MHSVAVREEMEVSQWWDQDAALQELQLLEVASNCWRKLKLTFHIIAVFSQRLASTRRMCTPSPISHVASAR